MMEINKFKNKYNCTSYSGIRKIVKLLVKYNSEMIMILMGTLYFKIFEKSEE